MAIDLDNVDLEGLCPECGADLLPGTGECSQNCTASQADPDETEERTVYVTYRITLDMPVGAEPNQIMEHQDVTAPATGEIIDWYFEEERGRR